MKGTRAKNSNQNVRYHSNSLHHLHSPAREDHKPRRCQPTEITLHTSQFSRTGYPPAVEIASVGFDRIFPCPIPESGDGPESQPGLFPLAERGRSAADLVLCLARPQMRHEGMSAKGDRIRSAAVGHSKHLDDPALHALDDQELADAQDLVE